MAKKKTNDDATTQLLTSTAELAGDGANPRKITDEGATGLRNSIKRFGDLSGIVWNKRTAELVAGHRRMEQITLEYGELPIVPIDEQSGLYGIRVSDTQFFPVRVVDWSPAMQRAANVAANNPKIQGTFTNQLSTYLLSVEAELAIEAPGVLDDCLLVELMAAGIDTTEAAADPDSETVEFEADKGGNTEDPTMRYQVIVEATGEEHQVELLERFNGEGLKCRALIS